MDTNPGFENWLDQKIYQLRKQGKNPTVQRDTRTGSETSYTTPLTEIPNIAGKMQSQSVETPGSAGSVDSGGDYYKFVWDEGEDGGEMRQQQVNHDLESPKDTVARILRETEHFAGADPTLMDFNDKGYMKFKSHKRQSSRDNDLSKLRGYADGQSDPALGDPNGNRPPPTSVQVAFKKYQSDVEQMGDDAYIDDDLVPDLDFSRDSRVRALLPMDHIEMELESDEETMMDLEPHNAGVGDGDNAGFGVADTQPIVTVDQADLAQKFLKRRQRLKIAVIAASVVACVGAFAGITYLVTHILTSRQ